MNNYKFFKKWMKKKDYWKPFLKEIDTLSNSETAKKQIKEYMNSSIGHCILNDGVFFFHKHSKSNIDWYEANWIFVDDLFLHILKQNEQLVEQLAVLAIEYLDKKETK